MKTIFTHWKKRLMAKSIRLMVSLFAVAILAVASGCDTVDNKRLPAVPVQIVLSDPGGWITYGVSGAMQSRRFIRALKVPADFPYTSTTFTGYGGVLLVSDVFGNPKAYDLACPVEGKADVRVEIDKEASVAKCPKCKSTYDVFANEGSPLSGDAARLGYGLTRYNVYHNPGVSYVIAR